MMGRSAQSTVSSQRDISLISMNDNERRIVVTTHSPPLWAGAEPSEEPKVTSRLALSSDGCRCSSFKGLRGGKSRAPGDERGALLHVPVVRA